MTPAIHLVELQGTTDGSIALTEDWGIGALPIGAIGLDSDFTSADVTFRLADREYTSEAGSAVGVARYRGLVTSAVEVERRIPLEPSAAGFVGAAWGEIEVANPDGYWSDLVESYAVDGRSARILRGTMGFDHARGILLDPAHASFAELFVGTALGWSLDTGGLRVAIRDRTSRIERTLQGEYYGGTGGADGSAEIAGRVVPWCRGDCRNVTPLLEDPANLIYRVNNAPADVTAVYERGVAGYVDAGDVADRAALVAASGSGGTFLTCRAEGRFRLFPSGSVQGEITADVLGEFAGAGYQDQPVGIARWMLEEDLGLGSSVVDTAAFAAVDASLPYPSGLWLADETDAVEALGIVLRSVGACLFPTRGSRLAPLRLAPPAGAPAATYDEASVIDMRQVALPETLTPPNYRRAVACDRNWTVQQPDLDAAVSDARRAWLAKPYRTGAWFDGAIRARHLKATNPPTVEGILRAEADAQAVAATLGAVWGVPRQAWDVDLPLEVPDWDLGDEIAVTFPIGPFAEGASCRVIGERLSASGSRLTVTVLL